MKFTILKFTISLITLFSLFFTGLIFYVYYEQQEKTASVILQTLDSQIAEVSYVVSRNIIKKEDILQQRPYFERVSANNEYIKAILVHDNSRVLVSTDPFEKNIFFKTQKSILERSMYDQLRGIEAIESKIRYYDEAKVKNLNLIFVLNSEELDSLFYANAIEYFIYFFLVPLLSISIIWFIVKKYIVRPLEKLRQYVYYQSSVPHAFAIKELEIIRYTMVETFHRLEDEKKVLFTVARTDSLSGLANRNALMEYLVRLIDVSKKRKEEFAMLFLDLDQFKSVNDSLGHNVGDELLKKIASIIEKVLESSDFVARVGGDEFVVILQNYSSMHELIERVQEVQKSLMQTIVVQANPISISSSVGIALYPKDGDNIVSLMKNSDIAMYEAKKNGRSQYHFFTEELNRRVQDTIKLEKEMRDALANEEYALFYQPKVELGSGKIVGAEALIRWISPSKGVIPPTTFIPLAEENGFIIELGDWVLQTAMKQQAAWMQKGIALRISINLSSKQLLADDFIPLFINTLTKYKVNPAFIDIEITEYMFYENNEKNRYILNALNDLGVSISLDDFGTGFSSLAYLRDFPIDYLKIDKSFVDNYTDEKGRVFIETIVKMGQTLKMKIIAEGVEEAEQVEYLNSIGCDEYQGFFMSRALNVRDFERFYKKREEETLTEV